MSKDAGLIQLASIQALQVLNEAVNELSKQVVVLENERDEYRRKWLDSIQGKQKLTKD